MTSFDDPSRAVNPMIGLYYSRQFGLYVLCGVLATIAHLSARYALNLLVSFSTAVLLSYVVGMLVALFLYRNFVFNGLSVGLSRQVVLFVAAYLAFFPVTWGLSVAAEAPLLRLLPPDPARLIAHLIGVGVPVMLNLAFNKLVTFRDGPVARTLGGGNISTRTGITRSWSAGWALLALICVYAAAVAVIGLSGNFPLNDDWAFANTTRDFVSTGLFTPSSWSSIPLLTEILVASPVCMVTTCGADDLRVVTLLAAMVLFSATFVLVARNDRNVAVPLLAAASVAFNPIALTLSFTFMSDILFAALTTVGAILFIRSLERGSVPMAVLGTVMALAATLTRQLGLCLPLAYLAVALVQMIGGSNWRRRSLLAVLPLAVCAAALVLLKQWLSMSGRLPALYDIKSNILIETLHNPLASLMRVGHNVAVIVTYLGLFALPVLVVTRRPSALPAEAPPWVSRLPRLVASTATALSTVDLASLHRLMPSGGNVLTPQGVGPLLLRDSAVLGMGGIPPLPPAFWVTVTLFSLMGAFLLVERVTARVIVDLVASASRRRIQVLDRAQVSLLFAGTAALSYSAPLLLIPFYDRYLIPLMPLTFFLVAGGAPRCALGPLRSGVAAMLCLIVSTYAVLAVHDYMAWNRARWRAIADLEITRGIKPDRIDGGMEYNGLRAYRADYVTQAGKSWWWVDRDDYQITFEPVAGLETVAQYTYKSLLPPAERSIKVLRKLE